MKHRSIVAALSLLVFINSVIGDDDPTKEIFCKGMEIRFFEHLKWLDNCTVVDGNLALIFPMFPDDTFDVKTIKTRSFPKLREVTGYLFLYLLEYVTNLQILLPNLTVIRGTKLFSNYALVIYNCEALEEMTLRNLLRISRGSVRLSENLEKLCFPEKIDFDKIILNGRLVIPANQKLNPNACKIRNFNCHTCPNGNCWHNGACQRFKTSYHVKNKPSQPCHEMCLGPCINQTASGCFTCEDISQDGVCVKSCSEDRVLNIDSRRCISKSHCSFIGRKVFKTECLSECPANYSENYNETTKEIICMPCINKCMKTCNFSVITTIQQLEKFGTGCTIINGSLEISLKEDISNLTAELQKYLGDVEEIHGSLKIHRSTSITSLTFLNNLKRVHAMRNYTIAIHIFENQNLQSLFGKVEVVTGSVYIHDNIMLCDDETKKFIELIQPVDTEFRKHDQISNNGNLRACKNPNIKTYPNVLSYNECEICWEDSTVRKEKPKFYLIQYLPVDDFELTEINDNILYERNSCSAYVWLTTMISYTEITNKTVNGKQRECFVLRGLDQYTFYAFIIQPNDFKTDIQNLSQSGASEINKFRTIMEKPSRVSSFYTHAKTSTSITLAWSVKLKEKDAIQQFFINVYEGTKHIENLEQRDYCKYPIVMDTVKENDTDEIEKNFISTNANMDKCCKKCCEEKMRKDRDKKEDEDFRDSLIKFTQVRRKSYPKSMENLSGFLKSLRVDGEQRSVEINGLKVYSFYTFYIYACTEDVNKCSEYEMHHNSTALEEKYDQIDLIFETNQFLRGLLKVYFEEPKDKNGAILKYLIEIREEIGGKRYLIKSDCITRKKHEDNKYYYTLPYLIEGNYDIRVAAVSLARQGPFTKRHIFKIIHPTKDFPIEIIIIGTSFFFIVLIGMALAYYYRYKIYILIRRYLHRRPQDEAFLLQEMEIQDPINNHNAYNPNANLFRIEEADDE